MGIGAVAFARKKPIDIWLCVVAFAVAVGLRFAFQYHQFDDAYITFRYCLNIVRGNGFVYNVGERVLGTTTPLFTALLAGLGFVFHTENFPLIANIINHVADGCTAVVLYAIGRGLWRSRAPAFLLALYFAVNFHSVFYSGSGMECEFYSFLLVFALERALRRRLRTALLLAAIAIMTRPDGMMLGVTLVAYIVITSRKQFRITDPLPALALLAAYLGTIWLYFGTLMPQSVVAKEMMWGGLDRRAIFEFPNYYEVMMFWSGFLSRSHSMFYWNNVIQAIPVIVLFMAGVYEIGRRRRRMLLLPAFGLFFTFAYSKTSVYMFSWYLLPTVPYLVLGVFAGVKLLGERLCAALRLNPARGAAVVCALLVLSGTFVYFGGSMYIPSSIDRVMYPRHTRYLYLTALNKIPPQKTPFSILAPEIGYIGYFRPEARIIDGMGLTNPEVTDYYGQPSVGWPKQATFVNFGIVQAFKPDYIITLAAFMERGIEKRPEFLREYELIPVPIDMSLPDRDREDIRLYRNRKRPI
ncbi:hypothetical protein LLG95_00110 [bacterium]|nr:hypothetical protein [bacterium]